MIHQQNLYRKYQRTEQQQQIRQLQTENEILRTQAESQMSLESIEQYATEKLGMQRCSPGQIILVEIPDEKET